jgi:hypothetical protein
VMSIKPIFTQIPPPLAISLLFYFVAGENRIIKVPETFLI